MPWSRGLLVPLPWSRGLLVHIAAACICPGTGAARFSPLVEKWATTVPSLRLGFRCRLPPGEQNPARHSPPGGGNEALTTTGDGDSHFRVGAKRPSESENPRPRDMQAEAVGGPEPPRRGALQPIPPGAGGSGPRSRAPQQGALLPVPSAGGGDRCLLSSQYSRTPSIHSRLGSSPRPDHQSRRQPST